MNIYEVDIDYDLHNAYFKCLIKAIDSKSAIEKAKKLPFENKMINISAFQLTKEQAKMWDDQILIIE